MNLKQLREKLAALTRKMETLNSACVSESGNVRAFTDSESEQYRTYETEAKTLQEAIDRAVAVEDQKREAARLDAPINGAARVEIVREERHNEDGEYRGFRHFGDFLRSVCRAAVPGAARDPRLDEMQQSATRAASGMNESNGSEGGFFVQTDFQTQLMTKTYESSTLAQLCEQVTISSNSNALEWNEVVEDSRATGSRHGGVRVYRDKEAGTVNPSKVNTRRDRIVVEKLTAIAYLTEEITEDAAALETMIEPQFTSEMGFVLDEEIVTGDGNGECEGILNSPALITLAKESGQPNGTLVYDNVRKMHGRIFSGSVEKAIWLIGSGVSEELEIMSFTPSGGTSIPVYMPANGISGRKHGTLYGADAKRNEHCSAIGQVGDILYIDLSQYRLVRKGGVKGAVSQHVRFIYGENTFRWTARVNGKSLWRAPLTPAKGTLQESPFVTLAKRAA